MAVLKHWWWESTSHRYTFCGCAFSPTRSHLPLPEAVWHSDVLACLGTGLVLTSRVTSSSQSIVVLQLKHPMNMWLRCTGYIKTYSLFKQSVLWIVDRRHWKSVWLQSCVQNNDFLDPNWPDQGVWLWSDEVINLMQSVSPEAVSLEHTMSRAP